MNYEINLACKIDQATTYANFLDGKCVRLFGVKLDQLENINSEKGVETFLIEIKTEQLTKLAIDESGLLDLCCLDDELIQKETISSLIETEWSSNDKWIIIKALTTNKNNANGYYFRTFINEDSIREQDHLTIQSITTTPGPYLISPPVDRIIAKNDVKININGSYKHYAYHVGQAMCSLIADDNNQYGIFLDAGVGHPIYPFNYSTLPVNQLLTRLAGFTSLDMVLTHKHWDHWSLLSISPAILIKIKHIYVNLSTHPVLALDPLILPKLRRKVGFYITLDPKNKISVLKSWTPSKNPNNNCFVISTNLNGFESLMPGDYVYEKFKRDANPKIRNLNVQKFDAVIVPHHGCKLSANDVLYPKNAGSSKAFFSAGGLYGHPTTLSLYAHGPSGKNYDVIKQIPSILQITEVVL